MDAAAIYLSIDTHTLGTAAVLICLPVDDWGHDDDGLSKETQRRATVRGPLDYRAWPVG